MFCETRHCSVDKDAARGDKETWYPHRLASIGETSQHRKLGKFRVESPLPIPDLNLTKMDLSAPGAEYIAIPLGTFSITGPNGSHQCIVLPVLGPCVSPRLWLSLKHPAPVLRKMAFQSALAMNCLHKQGLCHGGKHQPHHHLWNCQ